MIRICCVCGYVIGEKEPFEDPSQTHGFCPPCARSYKRPNQRPGPGNRVRIPAQRPGRAAHKSALNPT